MRSGQFNNRKPRNAVGAGRRSSGNEFNTSSKMERHPEPPQYPTSQVDERKRYSESRDARPKRDESRSQSSSSSRSDSSSSSRSSKSSRSSNASRSRNLSQNMTQGLVRSAVGMMAGAVIVTNSYQTAVEQREIERVQTLQSAEISELMSSSDWPNGAWTWSEDYTVVTLSLPGFDDLVADVTEDVVPPNCTEEGTTTYTATVTVKEHTLTDTRVETSGEPTGHSFGEPESVDGKTVFHCTVCDEEFEIAHGITKER